MYAMIFIMVIKMAITLVLLTAVEANGDEMKYYTLADKWNVDATVDEDLDTDTVFKVTAKSSYNKIMNDESMESTSTSNEEYHVEFNAFGENHKIKLLTHHEDGELASAFGDNYGVYSIKDDETTGSKKLLKHADSLGDVNTILDCIYKGERDDGAVAVYVACNGADYLLISKLDGENNEQIEVKKDKKTGKMKASKTKFSEVKRNDHDGDQIPPESPNNGNRRRLAANECTISPQKYLSLVVVNSISRVNKFGSNTATEADTVAQFLTGKVSYDRMTTPLGCNLKVRLAGQMFETANNKLIKEPFCSDIDETLSVVQTSHNANSGSNGCCSAFPVVWANCQVGETKCWNANAPNNPSGWSSAASNPAPGVNFTTDGGCYNYKTYNTYYSGSKSVTYYGMNTPYLASNSSSQISHGYYLDFTSQYFQLNSASLRSTFGDVDNVQGWTQNSMHSGVAGLGWVSTQCNDYFSTSVVSAKWGVYVWLHEMGHNLGMNHQPTGIMGRRQRRQLIDFFAPESEADMENFLINKYGVNGGARCLENNPPTRNPTPRPTLRPDFIPTKMPTAGNGGRCDPYICGGSNCGEGNSCWRNNVCYNWTGVGEYQSCQVYACAPGLSCNPDTRLCTPCSGTESPTFSYIPGGGKGDKCNPNECSGSTCDPKLTCDSDGICKTPGNVAAGGICRQSYCQQGLTCNPLTDTCTACLSTTSPTTAAPTTAQGKTGTPDNSTQMMIIGGAVGGAVALIGLGAVFFCMRRWRHNKSQLEATKQEKQEKQVGHVAA